MLKDIPLVTIVCSCFNHENYVLDSLNSILGQTYPAIQLIIVDDFSRDRSKDVIEKWLIGHKEKEILFIKNSKNLGLNKSFNNAYQYVKGEFVMDFSADDILFPEAIALLIFTFQNTTYEKCGIVFGNAKFYTIENSFERDYLPQNERPPTGHLAEAFQANTFEFCSVSALYKRDVYDQLNGYDEDLLYEDLDFWLRATRLYQVDYTSEFIVKRQSAPTSMQSHFFRPLSKRTFLMNWCTFKIVKKAFKDNHLDSVLNRALLKRVIFYRKRLKYNFLLKCQYLILEHQIKGAI
jgi:glycosyltransferase involved in cell wall biosynthesis